MNTLEYYIKFANDVFNTLNNKINIVNRGIILNIVYAYHPYLLGSMFDMYRLDLYINNLIRNDDQHTKELIVDTIIHELFHADQPIMDNEYEQSQRYEDMIEGRVEFQTAVFILDNIEWINNAFGVNLSFDKYIGITDMYMKYNDYRRLSLYELYMHKVNILIGANNHTNNIIFNYNNVKIYCEYSGDEFIIKRNGILNNNTELFNEFISKNIYSLKRTTIYKLYEKDNFVIIHIIKYESHNNKVFSYSNLEG